jgi:cytochrome P450
MCTKHCVLITFSFFVSLTPKILSKTADRWKSERKLLNTSFSLPVLQSYVPAFDRCIRQSVEDLKSRCDKGEFDVKHDVMLVVMNAVLSESNARENAIKTCKHLRPSP